MRNPSRVTRALLVLAVHAPFALIAWIEARMAPSELPAAPQLLSIALRLQPLLPPERTTASPANLTRQTRASVTVQPAVMPITEPTPPPIVPGVAAPAVAPIVDWQAQAAAAAARYARDVEPVRASGQASSLVRQPCTPRTNFDEATAAQMKELLPLPRDLPLTGGGGETPSVKMGGVRVGLLTLGGGPKRQRDDSAGARRSFKWRSDYHSSGGSAGLTMGWEKPDPYTAMFDDMKAGKTPDSSVPDPNVCD